MSRFTAALAVVALVTAACGDVTPRGGTQSPGADSEGAPPGLEIQLLQEGQPLRQRRDVRLTRLDEPDAAVRSVETSLDGTLRLSDLAPGRYRICVLVAGGTEPVRRQHPDGSSSSMVGAEVDVDGTVWTRATLDLPSTGRLHGTVTHPREVDVPAPYFVLQRQEAVDSASWTCLPHPIFPELQTEDEEHTRFRFSAVPTGLYRVVLLPPPGARAGMATVRVTAGGTTDCVIELKAAHGQLRVTVQSAPPEHLGRVQASVWNDGKYIDLRRGSRRPGSHTTLLPHLAPGNHIVLFEKLALATFVDIPPSGASELAYAPPAGLVDAKGVTLEVTVVRGTKPLGGLVCGMVPLHAARPDPIPGTWIRFARTHAGTGKAEFGALPPGRWSVWIFDGIGGAVHGIPTPPARRTVLVPQRDSAVTIDLDER